MAASRQWRVYLEGIALGAVVVEAESEADAIDKANEDDDLDVLVQTHDVTAVSAVPLGEDGGEDDDPRDDLERGRAAFSEGRSAYDPSGPVEDLEAGA